MKTSAAGRALIERFEGCRLEAYRDSEGVWTIGYGHTRGVRSGMKITQDEADALLSQDLVEAENDVSRLVDVALEQHEFDALVSFDFNLGARAFASSTLLRKLNHGDRLGAAREFPNWCHAGGKPFKGLLRRRLAEAVQFLG